MKHTLLVLAALLSGVLAMGQTDATPPPPPPPPVVEAPPAGWFSIPGTKARLKIGGYVKLDMIYDMDPIDSPYYFDVTKIPTDGSEGENFQLNARETRLHFDARVPTKIGEVRTYIEGDFYGSSGAFRLRHAFVELGDNWLAGQWWSNFMDESVIPATLDFEKPAAYAFARHAMFRWKGKIKEASYVAIAVEQPTAKAQMPEEPGDLESPLPDLTARYRLTKKWGHIQLSGFGAMTRFRPDSGSVQDIGLYGANLSGMLKFHEKDHFIFQVVYGPGSGRFRSGLSAGLDENGKLEPLVDLGITVGVTHYWCKTLSTLLVYNQGMNDNTEGQPGSDLHTSEYVAGNLIWHFIPNAFAGIEYLHGIRTDKDDSIGRANRFQFSVKYAFN